MSDSSDTSSTNSTPNAVLSRAGYQRQRRRRRKRQKTDGNPGAHISDSSKEDSSVDEVDMSEDDLNPHNEPGATCDEDEAGSSNGDRVECNQVDNVQSEDDDAGMEYEAVVMQRVEEEDARPENEVPDVLAQPVNLLQQEDLGVDSEGSGNDSSATESELDDNIYNDSGESDQSEGPDDVDNDRLFEGSALTHGELLLTILTFFMRHKLTGQCLGDLLSLIAMIIPPGIKFTYTLYKFKKYFAMIGQSLVVFHYFCSSCESPLVNENDECEHCQRHVKANFFLELPLFNQLQSMFLRQGFYESLQFRFHRVNKFMDNFEDIYDGQMYKDQVDGGFLSNPNHISFMWYSDGISIYKSSKFSIWPIFLVINELIYKVRTKRENVILAGLLFGATKPSPNIFLRPLHNDLERFKSDGHLFQRSNGPPVLIKGKMLCAICDLQAKCRFMRFKQWNGILDVPIV